MFRLPSRLLFAPICAVWMCAAGASDAFAAPSQGCAAAPPTNLTATIDTGRVVDLEWRFGSSSQTVSYVIQVGTSPGASDVMVIDTAGSPIPFVTSRIVQLPAGTHFIRVRSRDGGCLSAPTNEVTIAVAPSSLDDANALAFRCPTAAEVAAIDADIKLTFDGDPSAGTTVCTAGSRALTFLQANAYRALVVMQRQTFDAPLPWTSESLYNWLIHSIKGIRFRSDIGVSFCCDPADTINIQTGVAAARPSPDDPATLVNFTDLLVHETRHNNQFPHTCGNDDQTLAELGAWGAQYYNALWSADHSDRTFLSTRIRDSERRSADIIVPRFCSTAGPTMTVDRSSLAFAATTASNSFASQTGSQVFRLRQASATPLSWTAVSNVPWLTVTPASGRGPAALNVTTQFASGLTASQQGNITLTIIGTTSAPGPVKVTLTTATSGATASPPFGNFDTPAGDATPLAGSIALTGWALDNVGVKQVELWRDLQPGETSPPFAGAASDPRTGKVFISNATFVDGARPDVEALYASTPFNYRAGWGYLLLTWGLWNQGNGTYKFYAFALDQEGNTTTLGTKTVIVNNNAATKPFGSIDTPLIGGDPGTGPNYGWGLTPKVNGAATCKIPSNGVQVSIDSGPLQPVVYGEARTDIAGLFPGFSNTAAAGGHFFFDWSTLTNGPHTIVWVITDDCNRSDGVGSRVFNVTNGTNALTAADFRLKAETTDSLREATDSLRAASGFSRKIRQGERLELPLPRGFDTAYQLAGNDVRPLPIGSTWDPAAGMFYWQPPPGFLGVFRLVFSDGARRLDVRITVYRP